LVSSFTSANHRLIQPLHDLCAYTNLMMAHVDVEPVSEEELLAGRGSQYSALVFSDVDWMREDVVDKLSALPAAASPVIILDKDTEVSFTGSNVQNMDLSLVDVDCTGASYAGDYGRIDHLDQISSAIGMAASPEILISDETVIYRKYAAGDAKYLWLVNVHSHDEYVALFDWMTYHGGYSNQTALAGIKTYLQSRGVYDGKIRSTISLLNIPGNAVVVDVMDGKILSSSVDQGWTSFDVDIDRLAGKLVAIYPALPSRVVIEAPQNMVAGQKYSIKAAVSDGANNIASSFPLYVELIDPSGKKHAYSQFSATDGQGKYELPITLGTNAAKGVWVARITELSTNIMSAVRFTVQ
ncbi:MAG: hypothetical protein AABX05_01345, partial [Nanoarchaeota archaeon]